MDIWEDSYKSGRWIVTLKEIQSQSKDVLLTFDSGNKEQGMITIAVAHAEYQKMETISSHSDCEIKVFAEGEEARKACHVKKGIPIMLDKRAWIKIPMTALRATIDYWNDWNDKQRNHLVGAVVDWSIRKD